jgi:phage shock protein PspC (stress-responsive transcriptional regulator)
MYRSFTDRVLGGVCGGLGTLLRVNPWLLRTLFVVLTILSLGAAAILYLILWMMVPQQSLALRQRGGSAMFLLALLLTLAAALGWIAWMNGGLRGPGGEPLYWIGLFLVAASIFFLRQLRGA